MKITLNSYKNTYNPNCLEDFWLLLKELQCHFVAQTFLLDIFSLLKQNIQKNVYQY